MAVKTDTENFLYEIRNKIQNSTVPGPGRTEAYLKAIMEADQYGDPYARLSIRSSMVVFTPFYDDAVKILPVCAEFFAIAEQYPEAADAYDIFVTARGAANLTIILPEIEMPVCEKMFSKMEEAAKVVKSGAVRRMHMTASEFYTYVDQDTAKQHYDIFINEKMGMNSSCTACEQHFMVLYHLKRGDVGKAHTLADRIFYGGLSCHDIPWQTYAIFIEHYMDTREDMKKVKNMVYKLIQGGIRDCSDIGNIGSALRCLAKINPQKGYSLLFTGLQWSINMWNKQGLYDFYKGAWCFCREAENPGQPVSIPQGHPLSGRKMDMAGMAEWFYSQAAGIAESFDKRNGTDCYTKNLMMAQPSTTTTYRSGGL